MEIKFHGQSCFELSEGETRVLVDPFLKPNNPVAVTSGEEVDPTHVFLSHGHADHVADAVGVPYVPIEEALAGVAAGPA